MVPMSERLLVERLSILIVTLIASVLVWVWPHIDTVARDGLQVDYLAVGQGDATLVTTPDGIQVLIDGGPGSSVLTELGSVMPWWDRDIDMVVATHPDKDHIGGLVEVFDRYHVGVVVETDKDGDSAAARAYHVRAAAEQAEIVTARRGQVYTLGASTTLEILYPETATDGDETNAASVVLRIVYGETSFLFTGDAPKRVEEYLVLAYGEHLKSTVLQVGHHGSRTSTSELFLDEVQPEFAVISAAPDSQYGHPHVEVTDLLFNKRVETYETAEEGTVTLLSDGQKVWLK